MSKNKNLTVQEWLQTDDPMCADIVDRKYLLEADILGHKETVDELLDRVSGGNQDARELMEQLKFLPGGRIIANRELQKYGIKVTYSNCYVEQPPEDNIESIYDTCGKLARTFSYGGGIGIDVSKLAPAGAKVNNTSRKSTGAVSFVNTFSQVAETIGMRGRRGALMISIDCKHPDLEEFITHKSDLKLTQGANMSVRMNDEFFQAVKEDSYWTLEFHRPETDSTITKQVKARDILYLLAKTNWDYGEPGILYWDRIEKYNLMSNITGFSYAGTNPCGEEPLPAGGSCLLGAMNLSAYYNKESKGFNYSEFSKDVKIAVRFLNQVLNEGRDLHPLKIQKECVSKWRQIGLGVMGLADLFVKCKLEYGSENSIKLVDKIGYTMIAAAIEQSIELATETASSVVSNPHDVTSTDFWKYNIDENPMLTTSEKERITDKMHKHGIYNSQLLTCAPTGTISTILGISGGIEPMFSTEYTRTTKSLYDEDRTYIVHPKAVELYLKENNLQTLGELKNKPTFLTTSRNIDWIRRLEVQAALQRHIDASISSTVNLPESTTIEEVMDLYTAAHELGLKGVTVFRENCQRVAILNDTSTKKKDEKPKVDVIDTDKKKQNAVVNKINTRATYTCSNDIEAHKEQFLSSFTPILTRSDFGEYLRGSTYYEKVACGHIYITVNRFAGRPVEVFMQSSKSGGCAANTEALGRLASTMLRAGIDPKVVIDSTLGVKCAACSTMKGKGEQISGLSCSDVMARIIRKEYNKYINGDYDNEIKEYLSSCESIQDTAIKDIPGSSLPATIDNKQNYDMTLHMITGRVWDYTNHTVQENIDHYICPECGKSLRRSEGCLICDNCGFSKC